MTVIEILPSVTITIEDGVVSSPSEPFKQYAEGIAQDYPRGPEYPNYDRFLAQKIIEIAGVGEILKDTSVTTSVPGVTY